MKFEEIPEEQLFLLTAALHHPPSEHWTTYAERVNRLVPQLDRVLVRPDFLHRLLQLPQSHYAPLCGLHRTLNVKFVHKIFLLVATEVGLRLNKLIVAGRNGIGHKIWDRGILNLRSLHGAWLHPEVFNDTFSKTLHVPKDGYSTEDYMTKWRGEDRSCEACTLSRIGGDLGTVLDLQMVILSRTRSKSRRIHRRPRLARVIEGWLRAWEPFCPKAELQISLEKNRQRAANLKDIRKRIARTERRTNSKYAQETEHVKTDHDNESLTVARKNEASGIGNIRPQTSRQHFQDTPSQTIKVYFSDVSNPEITEVEDIPSDGEDDGDLRQTIYDAEHEIINCYAALISTPFLPGMDSKEHQKRVTTLSRHCSTPGHDSGQSWPMVGGGRIEERIPRSQSTRHRRPSNYSDSVYSQKSAVVSKISSAVDNHSCNQRSPTRNQSIQNSRVSNTSWVTASVLPSEVSTNRPRSVQAQQARPSGRILPPRSVALGSSKLRTNDTKPQNVPVSPIREEDTETKNRTASRAARSGRNSPVSPLTPISTSSKTQAARYRHPSHNINKAHITSSRTCSQIEGDNCPEDQLGHQEITSKSSKAPGGPAIQCARPSHFIEHIVDNTSRTRDSIVTDITRWSDLYVGESEGIKCLEKQFSGLNVQAEEKSSRNHTRR